MQKTTLWWIIGIIVVIIALFAWSKATQDSDPTIVTRGGIHWHPTLTIYVDDEQQEIPANIGLGGVHQPIHTHVEDAAQGVLHFEFEGLVRSDDLRLGNFFQSWDGKDVQTAFGTLERMVVNGGENTEYGDYVVESEDNIELYYTTPTL